MSRVLTSNWANILRNQLNQWKRNRTNMSHRAPCPGLWLVSGCLCSCNNLFCFFSLSSSILTEEEKKKKVVRLPVQRSVETGLAIEFKARFTRQPSRDPDAEDPKPGAYESLLFLLFLSCILCLVKLYSYSTHLKQGVFMIAIISDSRGKNSTITQPPVNNHLVTAGKKNHILTGRNL